MMFRRSLIPRFFLLLLPVIFAASGSAALLTAQTNRLGSTPDLIAYNSGHFLPGSNTDDWWHYAGMGGARVFMTASVIEPDDDIAGHGDGVTNQTTFVSRKAALRINPLDTNYINWPFLIPRFSVAGGHGANILDVDHSCSRLRALGVEILINLTASQGQFSISDTNDWAGKWELWQHFYFEAFYLGREYDVERFQMYNEPDHPNAGGLTREDYLMRLQLSSDAVQSAQADVNRIYGKSLKPRMVAPVTAGAVSTTYPTWGRNIITNRHVNYLGEFDTNFSLIGQYDYHEYNSAPTTFGNRVAGLHSNLTVDMFPEPRYPSSISEFNVHTAGTFDTLTETLDTPSKYVRFGAIVVNLVSNSLNELYCFKFSQTGDEISVKKNGMHFVDNDNFPFNIGGITKAGEVYRLFSKATAPGGDRLSVTNQTGTALDIVATFDAKARRRYLFSANSSNDVNITLNASAWNLPDGQRVLLEEVSEKISGGARALLTVTSNQINAGVHASNTVWLFNMPTQPQEPMQTLLATHDAMVQDGTNRFLKYGTNPVCVVKNNSTNANGRNAALVKFQLPPIYLPDLQFALLVVRASSTAGTNPVQAHVYGITNNNWSQNTLNWANAPGLQQNVAAGTNIINNFIAGQGMGAQIVGQIVADSTLQDRMIDVTKFLRENPGSDVSFLLAREVRFAGDVQNTNGLSFVSKEGDTNSGPRLVLVTSTPSTPFITQQPIGETVVEGQAAGFSVEAISSTPLAYQWQFRGTNILNATNSAYALSNITTLNAGEYSVVLSNAIGSLTSDSAILVVDLFLHTSVNPVVGGTILISPEQTGYAVGSSVLLSAIANPGFAFVGWSGELVTTTNPLEVSLTNSKTFVANFIHSIDLIIDNPDVQYFGVWTIGTAAADKYGSYYQYAPTVSGFSGSANAVYTPNIPHAGKYDVSIWYPQRTNRSERATLLVAFENDNLVTNLDQTIGGGSWRFITTQSFAEGTNGFVDLGNDTGEINKVVVSDAVRFTYRPGPIIYSQPQSQNVKPGSNATFTVLAGGTGQLAYQWQFNEVDIPGATGSIYTQSNVQMSDEGNYTVVLSNHIDVVVSDLAALSLSSDASLSSVSVLPDGSFHFLLSGENNVSYAIEASTNLVNWETLTNVSSPDGMIEFIDPSSDLKERFYRVRSP